MQQDGHYFHLLFPGPHLAQGTWRPIVGSSRVSFCSSSYPLGYARLGCLSAFEKRLYCLTVCDRYIACLVATCSRMVSLLTVSSLSPFTVVKVHVAHWFQETEESDGLDFRVRD